MDGLAGPLFIAASLVVVAGIPKVADPSDTTRALRSVGLPGTDLLVRGLAVAEVAIGISVIVLGGRFTSGLLALLYAGFAGFIVLAMRRGGSVASCGCFGKADTPPTMAHVLLDVSAATVALAATIAPPASLSALLGDQPAFGIPFVAFVAMGAWLGYLVLTLLPALQAARSST
jgi:hypothetical protein